MQNNTLALVNFNKNIKMKKILLIIILPFFAHTQTTHYFNWGYNTVNQQIEIEAGDTVNGYGLVQVVII